MDEDFLEETVEGEEEGDDGPCAKMGASFGACCLGMVLFPLTLLMLGWNENNYVCQNNRILYADDKAEVVGCSSRGINDEFVFFSCPIVPSTLKTFTPCMFQPHKLSCSSDLPVSFASASAKQQVEMYQCTESCETHKDSRTRETTKQCRYSMQWADRYHDSSRFDHSLSSIASHGCPDILHAQGNPDPPANLNLGSSPDLYDETVVVGTDETTGFVLNKGLIERLLPDTSVPLTQYTAQFSGPMTATTGSTQTWSRPLAVSTANLGVNGVYLQTCNSPKLGCVRISYSKSGATSPSVITNVKNEGLTEEESIPGSWGCSKSQWQSIKAEKMTKEEMIEHLHSSNQTTTWLLRIIGLIMAWVSMYCCFCPISAAADVIGDFLNFIPCVGGYLEDFLEGVVDWVVCMMSCSIGCSCALFVIAVGWIAMRPMYGLALMAVCLCLCCCAFGIRSQVSGNKRRKKNFDEVDDEYGEE